jgi:dienelactone hydrolase
MAGWAGGWSRRGHLPTVEALAGEYWVPDDADEPGPAIVFFGGSDGGFDRHSPAHLARAGLPTLSLAYWTGRDVVQDLPGLPTALEEVPLEYFESAIRWLADQPEVDPARIYVWGTSRGGEAALLLGATYPELVHGVIANAPSNVVNPSYPGGGTTRSGWSLGGEPVPMVTTAEESATGTPTAREIPIEDFDGPILLTCGELDENWPACPMSRRAVERLEEHGYPHRVELAAYSDIDHYLNFPTGSLAADPRDGDEAWQRTLEFIDETS